MSDDQERRLREALRDGVPEPPGVPAYGVRLAEVARRRRAVRRGAVVGGAALAVAAVVAVVATTVGGPAPMETQPPVASGSVQADVACEDSATVQRLPAKVTAVRLCIGFPASKGATPRVPSDVLVGAAARDFGEALVRSPVVSGLEDCIATAGPVYRFVLAGENGDRSAALLHTGGCQLLTAGSQRLHGRGLLDLYLRMVGRQRDDLAPPEQGPDVICPTDADSVGSTLGADLPARDEAISAVLCRYDRDTSELRSSIDVGQGTQADELAALTDGARKDPCTAIRVKPPKYDDRVLLVDAYGDVVVATAFFCTSYEVDGQPIWPDQQLQGLVNRLFRSTEAAG